MGHSALLYPSPFVGSSSASPCAAMAARAKLVKPLRAIARAFGVPQVRDNAPREKVPAMVAGIRKQPLERGDRQKLEDAVSAYLASFPGVPDYAHPAGAGDDASGSYAAGFRVRGRSFLLTYNRLFADRAFPDGTPPAASNDDLWSLWCDWKKRKKKELGVEESTSTLEESLDSEDAGRVHFHWKLNLKKAIDNATPVVFAFHGVVPDVRPTVALTSQTPAGTLKAPRGASLAEASNRAHFYAWAPKKGTLFRGTNRPPWKKYRVQGKWLDDLWTDEKLDNDHYEALALRVRAGFADRKRNVEAVRAAEKEAWIDDRVSLVDTALDKIRAPFREFPAVREWEESFFALDFRWKLLALVADSASGKSSYAESLFSKPLVLTVEEAEHLDLRSFQCDQHDGLALDNCNSWAQLLRWRAVLQARNTKSRGGQSATNVHAYPQYLYGVAVVATVDWDAPDSYLVDENSPWRSRWLCKNAVFVRLAEGEAFYDKTRVPTERAPNAFSLFAQTVRRRRLAEQQRAEQTGEGDARPQKRAKA